MSIKPADAKALWARSGNRCAMCRNVLTPEGGLTTLGQMCHIVAQSEDGPRGSAALPMRERDRYNNLILLCRNDHGIIDSDEAEWSVDNLQRLKQSHEYWVTEQLSRSAISVSSMDNSEFLRLREKKWARWSSGSPALTLSLTPLNISEDTVDTETNEILDLINSAKIANFDDGESLNRNLTRPSIYGIQNELIANDRFEQSHTIELHRSGHCEYVVRFAEESTVSTNGSHRHYPADVRSASYVFRYTDIAFSVCAAVDWLLSIWTETQPENDMLIECLMLNVENTNLYSYERSHGEDMYGKKLDEDTIRRVSIVTPGVDSLALKFDLLSKISNGFGLYLNELLNEKEEFLRPTRNRAKQ